MENVCMTPGEFKALIVGAVVVCFLLMLCAYLLGKLDGKAEVDD